MHIRSQKHDLTSPSLKAAIHAFGVVAVGLLALTLLLPSRLHAEDKSSGPAEDWRSYIEPLIAAGEGLAASSPRFQDPQLRQELYRQLYSGVAMAYVGSFLGDAEHPDFWPYVSQLFNFLGPNPDDTYYLAPLDGTGSYRISGFRGTVHMVDFQIGSGSMMPHGVGSLGPTLASYDLDKVPRGKDGSFEVMLSGERPKDYAGTWWQIDKAATYVLVRQISYDWVNEVDGRYAIERLDRPAMRPRPQAAAMEQQLRAIPVWAQNWTKLGMQWVGSYRSKGLVNKVSVHSLNDVGGVSTQQYIEGQFEIGPDEALIYETELPKHCRYWNVQLADLLWAALDWKNRQTTLNGHTAHLDKDGKFRAVLSKVDPGVPNWLDTVGYDTGAILGRWTDCSSYPVPTITRVKLAQVREHLPTDTPTITPEQRDESLRSRRVGAQLRRRW